MSERQTVLLWEGYHFRLTDDQVAAIRTALDEAGSTHALPEPDRCGLLAQVWETETDGVVCCCHAVPAGKARIIRDVLRAADITAIKVEPNAARAELARGIGEPNA